MTTTFAASYVVTKAYLERESDSPDAGVCRVQSNNDFQIWFSYKHGGSAEGQMRLRESGGWVGVCGITGSGAVDLRDAPYRMERWTGPVFSANAEIQRRGHTNVENPLDSRVRGKDEPEA